MTIFFFIAGLLLILGGANFMTDGASSLARKLGMSDLVVGLTVVSMMTSAPELVVSLTSAFNASSSMAVGNVVGSNIFNILAIVGITALVRPITVQKSVLTNEIPMVILSSVALLAMGCAPLLGAGEAVVSRVDGILLLLFFMIFMRLTFAQARNASPEELQSESASKKLMPVWKSLIWLCGGLAGLVIGGDWFVAGASGIARRLGMSDAIIGLTIIAAGTSLPELATSVVAALKGSPGICIGNVIGSNIFNIFFVLGTTAVIKPLPFGGVGMFDLAVLAFASILFWAVGWFIGTREIKRGEGALMLAIYIAYMVTLCLQA